MTLLSRIAGWWRLLFDRRRLEGELDDELGAYLEDLTARKIQAGLDPEAARRAASMEMDGIEAVKEDVRSARIGRGLETTIQDVRYAGRGLWRSRGFAAAAVLTLALGIGANTAIFSVVNAMLIAPLPYRDASRLVFVWSDMSDAGYPRAPLSGPELGDLRTRSTRFAGFGAIWSNTAALTGDGDPEQLRIGLVTADFFSVLGADAEQGRTFTPDDDADSAPPRILLSWPLWQRRYAGDPTVVGRTILVNNQPTTVVGVMPADFRLLLPPDASVPDDLQAWLPFPRDITSAPRGQQFLRVVGRLRAGVSIEDGRQEIDTIASTISREFTEYGSAGRAYDTVALQADGVREIRPVLLALLGGVAILLLIACVNVASLLVARAASRRKEIALRMALGAGRGRLLRQCLVEGLLLSALGAAAGLLVARVGLMVLVAARPESLSRLAAARIDTTVLAFTGAAALLWGLLLSLAPLAEVFRANLVTALQREGRGSMGGVVHHRTRTVLVVVQMALGVVLLVGAGLVVRTFIELQRVDPGFRPEGVVTFRLALPPTRYAQPAAINAFSRALQRELSALPGVVAAGGVSHIPYDHLPNWGGPYLTRPGAEESTAPQADYRAITPGFFDAVGARLVEGRAFVESDDLEGAPVVIVDERLARRAWPGESALGKRLGVDPRSEGHPTTWVTVAGVVRHLRHRSLMAEVREQVYFPQRQILRNPMAYVLRTAGDPASVLTPLRRVIGRLDPQLPVYDVRPLSDYRDSAAAAQRFTMILAGTFAAVALILACVGLYGVIAYAVARRRHEFGIRLALGARPGQVEGLVVREGMRMAAAGLALGLPAAGASARLLQSQLFGVTPRDPLSYTIAVSLLAAAAVAASWIAARKATSASPLEVLRAE